jgi:hypothetical protein
MRVTICLIFAVVFFSCCKSKQNGVSTPPAKPAPATPLPTSDETAASSQSYTDLVISFYSIGGGINGKALKTIENFIVEYSKKINKSIPYNKISWGREGEVDFCISLAQLQDEEKKTFVDETRHLAAQFDLVHFFENHPCRELK